MTRGDVLVPAGGDRATAESGSGELVAVRQVLPPVPEHPELVQRLDGVRSAHRVDSHPRHRGVRLPGRFRSEKHRSFGKPHISSGSISSFYCLFGSIWGNLPGKVPGQFNECSGLSRVVPLRLRPPRLLAPFSASPGCQDWSHHHTSLQLLCLLRPGPPSKKTSGHVE